MGRAGLGEGRQIPEAHRGVLQQRRAGGVGPSGPRLARVHRGRPGKWSFWVRLQTRGSLVLRLLQQALKGDSWLISGATGTAPLACCSPPSPQAVAGTCGFK